MGDQVLVLIIFKEKPVIKIKDFCSNHMATEKRTVVKNQTTYKVMVLGMEAPVVLINFSDDVKL